MFLIKQIGFVAVVGVISLWAGGCTPTTIQMTDVNRASIKRAPRLVVLYHHAPEFFAPGPPSFGAGGGAIGNTIDAMASGGWLGDILKARPPQDPIAKIKDQFLTIIGENFETTALQKIEWPLHQKQFEARQSEWIPSIIFEFKTDAWGVRREAVGVDYIFWYRAIGRVIRLPDEEVLWQGVCKIGSKWDGDRLSFDDLVENNGAGLNVQLNKTADRCVGQLVEQFKM